MSTDVRIGLKEQVVEIATDSRVLKGIVNIPAQAQALVLFAHGSGSGRLSPRNQNVAKVLQRAGIATLLFDLLEKRESEDRSKVFDIGLLARRLQATTVWAQTHQDLHRFRLGYFGASTGAAAALVAAARQGNAVAAVVSRGGRPDMAMDFLPVVQSPTLLIVGSQDEQVLELNQQALAALRCEKQLTVIPGATHLFPETGALEQVAQLAVQWFQKYLLNAAEQ